MRNTARRNDSQWAEPGEDPSVRSVRGKNATSDEVRAHLAEAVVGTSLPSSRTVPALILGSHTNQTPSSVVQSIPPTGGNGPRQQVVGRMGGEGKLGASFLHKLPSSSEALPCLRLPKGCSFWCVQASQMDVIVPSFSPSSDKDHSVKPICLTHYLEPEAQIQSLGVLCGRPRQSHCCLLILRKDLLKIEPQLAVVHQKDRSVMHGLQNNCMALREILEGRSFGQHSLENYIYSR